jgi:hypothetical protein
MQHSNYCESGGGKSYPADNARVLRFIAPG